MKVVEMVDTDGLGWRRWWMQIVQNEGDGEYRWFRVEEMEDTGGLRLFKIE